MTPRRLTSSTAPQRSGLVSGKFGGSVPARVVDEDVHDPSCLDDATPVLLGRDVGNARRHGALAQRDELVEPFPFFLEVGREHTRAAGRERKRGRPADPPGPAGDDRGLAGELRQSRRSATA